MANTVNPVSVELAPGFYLRPDGIFTTKKPQDAITALLPGGSLNVPEQLKGLLNGKQLFDVRAGGGGVLNAVQDLLGMNNQLRKLTSDIFALAGSLASIVGCVQAAVKMVEMLGLLGPNPTDQALKRITQLVEQIWTLLLNLAGDIKITQIREQVSKARTAQDALTDYVKYPHPPPPQARQTLLNALEKAREARHNLLSSDYQKAPFAWSMFQGQQWASDASWIVHRPHPALTPPPDVLAGSQLFNGAYRWDYRALLPGVIEVVNTLLAFYKAVDPAFRTTGRFREELQSMAADLQEFVQRTMLCLQWTKDYDPFLHKWYRPMADGWPVGAVDACTGSSAFEPHWKKGVIAVPSPPGGAGLPDPPTVLNVQESLQRAAEERERAWMSVFLNSAVTEVAQLQRRVAELATPPRVSETVVLSAQRTGTRTEARPRSVVVPWSLGCNEKTFDARVFQIQREWRIRATTQPAFFAEQYTIPYRIYIEAYPHVTDPVENPHFVMERKELIPGADSTATVQASQFDWEVEQPGLLQFDPSRPLLKRIQSWHQTKYQTLTYAPGNLLLKPILQIGNIEAIITADVTEADGRVGKRYTGPVTFDYTLTKSDGEMTLRLRNRPADGNFAHVYLVIEETPRPVGGTHPPIRTVYELSTVAVELHLPRAYFRHVEGCKAALARILDYIHRKRIPAPVPPVPPWDPTRFPEVVEYLQAVNRLNPALIPWEMLDDRALRLITMPPPQGPDDSGPPVAAE